MGNYILIVMFAMSPGWSREAGVATIGFPTPAACNLAYAEIKRHWGDKVKGGQCIETSSGKSV